jgi:hypothetical protein
MKIQLISTMALAAMAGLALAQPPGMGMGPGAGMGPCNGQAAYGPGAGGRMGGPRHARMLKQVDTDGDGRVSQAEHDAMAAKRFGRFDTNGDGNVTRDEFVARSAARFKQVDANGDGYITQDERRAMRSKYAGKRGWPVEQSAEPTTTE